MNTEPKRISPYERLRRLQSVTDTALAPLSLDSLLDELLDRIRDALEADTCAVLLLDEPRRELVARAARGIEEEVEQGVRIPLGQGFAGRVAAERRPVVIPDVDHSEVLNPILREKGIRSLLGAPLLARERVLGVVHVGTLEPREFTQDDIELLSLVAARVAVALERSLRPSLSGATLSTRTRGTASSRRSSRRASASPVSRTTCSTSRGSMRRPPSSTSTLATSLTQPHP